MEFEKLKSVALQSMACVFLTLSPSGLKAQSSFASLEKNDLIVECLANVNELSDDDASAFLSIISDWKNIFATKLIADTRDCLLSLTGEEWVYSGPRAKFVSLAQQNADISAREQRRLDELGQQIIRDQDLAELERNLAELEHIGSLLKSLQAGIVEDLQQEAAAKTLATCNELYEKGPSEAILSPVCNPFYLKLGLPDSEIQRTTEQMIELSDKAAEISLRLSQE